MLKMVKWLVLIGGILTVRIPAAAQERPGIEWNDSTRLALAQCFLGEAGWHRRAEHSAIGHVLLRRWEGAVRHGSHRSFESLVRRYCAVHRVASPSPRQQWVRRMPWGPMTEDPGFISDPSSHRSPWESLNDDWEYVRETVGLFEAGLLVDPLPQADHWGGGMDGTPIGGVFLGPTVVYAGETVRLFNRFYRIDYEVARAYREMRRRHEVAP